MAIFSKDFTSQSNIIEPIYPLTPMSMSPGTSIILLGLAERGPLYKPLYIQTEDQANYYFGGELAKAFKDAALSDAPNIYMMRIGSLGESNVSKNSLFIYLQNAYEFLYGWQYDYIVPVGAYYDDVLTFKSPYGTPVNFARQLAEFCHSKKKIGEYSHGILAVNKINEDLNVWTEKMIESSLPRSLDGTLVTYKKYLDVGVDYGANVSIVVGWSHIIDDNEERDSNGAALYAGFLASLEVKESPTNKRLPIDKVINAFSRSQVEDLTTAGFTVFRDTIRRGIVPHEAVTFATPESDFYKMPNIRILNIACQNVQNAIQIGSPNTLLSPRDKATAALEEMVENGEIRDFRIEMATVNTTSLEIRMEIVPIFYLSSILEAHFHVNMP
jgi:hypothetical protein